MHNKVRSKHYLYKRRKLINSLFLIKPCYAHTLMEIKDKISKFNVIDFYNVQNESSESEFDINEYKSQVLKKLDTINSSYDTDLLNFVRSDLLELCRNVKKRLQHDELNQDEKVIRSKPLIYINQEIILKKIVHKFAKQDEIVLFNFLNLIQNMLRAKLYEAYLSLFVKFVGEVDIQIINFKEQKSASGNER